MTCLQFPHQIVAAVRRPIIFIRRPDAVVCSARTRRSDFLIRSHALIQSTIRAIRAPSIHPHLRIVGFGSHVQVERCRAPRGDQRWHDLPSSLRCPR
jgi:hypothetical protein